MMTATEMMPAVGQTVTLNVEGLRVDVIVQDVRTRFGSVDCLVKPVSGSGEKWVSISRLGRIAERAGSLTVV